MEKNTLLTGIIEKARSEADHLVETAEMQAKQRRMAQQAAVEKLHEEDDLKIAEFRETARRRSLSVITSGKRRMALKRREELTSEVVAQAKQLLAEQIAGFGYEDFLARCIAEGAVSVNRDEIVVSCSYKESISAETRAKAEHLVFESLGRSVVIRVSEEKLPDQGVVIASTDGKVSFSNQIAARFRRYNQDIMEIISKADAI